MRLTQILIGLIPVLMGVTACQADSATQPPPIDITSTPKFTLTMELPRPTVTHTLIPTTESTEAIFDGAMTPELIATLEPVQLLCSTLYETSLQELSEIVSDPYAPPPMGKDDRHQGVDFAYYQRGERSSIEGEIVQALMPGTVASVLNDRLPYGNMVIIETKSEDIHPDMLEWLELLPGMSLYHLYAHFGENPVLKLGQVIECGQPLGVVGKTGYNIVNAHLHLEMRIGPSGMVFESMAFYDTRATDEEMANYRLWRMSGEFQHLDPMAFITEYLCVIGEKEPEK